MNFAPGSIAEYLLSTEIIYRVKIIEVFEPPAYLVEIVGHEYLSSRLIGERFILSGNYLQPVNGLRLLAEVGEAQ